MLEARKDLADASEHQYEADMLQIGQQLKGTYRTAILASALVIRGLGIMAWGCGFAGVVGN